MPAASARQALESLAAGSTLPTTLAKAIAEAKNKYFGQDYTVLRDRLHEKAHAALLIGAAAVLLWARRRVRIADWLLLVAFGAASLMAYRNVVLVGFLAPILIVSYLPEWKRPMPAVPPHATPRRGRPGSTDSRWLS